jgi:nucleoside-diphosphate-sugar epimerase
MPDALIGHTGFVGGNLARQLRFDAFFNSANVEEIAGRAFDTLVVSGMPAAKWIANREPDADRAALERLSAAVRSARANRVVVISTVDVYPVPIDVDEDTPIDAAAQHTYGQHRLRLEREVADHFDNVLVVRLPALFGPGLKKNAVYDLLHDNEVHKIHSGGVFQWYNLDRLWADIGRATDAGLSLVNFATEPFSVADMAREAFGREFDNVLPTPPARYDFRTKHAAVFDGRDCYLYGRDQVMAELGEFVARERVGHS